MAGKRHHTANFFFSTLAISILTSTAVMPSEAGDMCDGLAKEELHNEVGLACPLKANVFDTKHSIVIKYVNNANNADDVLGCDWLSSSQKFDCLRSRFDAKLIHLKPDCVLARLPKDRLGNGTYRCQLVPPTVDNYLTDCDICYQVSTTENPTTQSSVIPSSEIPSTPAGHHGSNNPRERTRDYADGHHGELDTAVAFLSITVFCLLLTIIAMVVFFLWYRRRVKWKTNMHQARSSDTSSGSSTESDEKENAVNFALLKSSKATPGLEEHKSRMLNLNGLNLYPTIKLV